MALEDCDDGLRNKAAQLLGAICASGTLRYWSTLTLLLANGVTEDKYAAREVLAPSNIHKLLQLLSAPRPLSATVARLLGVLCLQDDSTPMRLPFYQSPP